MSVSTIRVGTMNFPSYASVIEADGYLMADPRYSTIWSGLQTEMKDQFLVFATRNIDRLTYKGNKTSESQPLQFPRDGGDFPVAVEHAAILLAASYAVEPPEHEEESSGAALKTIQAGPVELEYFRGFDSDSEVFNPFNNSEVMELLCPFLDDEISVDSLIKGGDASIRDFVRDRRPLA